jgi:hypothetical protein
MIYLIIGQTLAINSAKARIERRQFVAGYANNLREGNAIIAKWNEGQFTTKYELMPVEKQTIKKGAKK